LKISNSLKLPSSFFPFQPSFKITNFSYSFDVPSYESIQEGIATLEGRVSRFVARNAEEIKNCLYVAQIALIVFSFGYCKSFALSFSFSSLVILSGFFTVRFIDRCSR
jgi:hypothetical protein